MVSPPPEEGSSDDPEILEAHDPLRKHDVVLSDTQQGSTLFGQTTEPLEQDDRALEELHVVDSEEQDEASDDEDYA